MKKKTLGLGFSWKKTRDGRDFHGKKTRDGQETGNTTNFFLALVIFIFSPTNINTELKV